jgi:hypothetical protein
VLGRIAAAWGFVGVFVFLGSAIIKLAQISFQLDFATLALWQWVIMLLWVAFMAYYEGYKGFQKGFSPRVAARIRYLSHHEHATLKRLLFAPLFCLGFFDAERKRVVFIVCLTIGIVLLVKLVENMPMPWRGIMDAGVVVGLSWGLVSMVLFSIRAFVDKSFEYSAEVPEKS